MVLQAQKLLVAITLAALVLAPSSPSGWWPASSPAAQLTHAAKRIVDGDLTNRSRSPRTTRWASWRPPSP